MDRLLASPHYGERWGRHWLDQARYADSDSGSRDEPRQIYKYREWVIQALNNDMPFDRFVVEQLAGDLLPNATPEQMTATGFQRNSLLQIEAGTDREQYRVEAVMDRVDTFGDGAARPVARLRALPRSQVRSHPAARILSDFFVLQ